MCMTIAAQYRVLEGSNDANKTLPTPRHQMLHHLSQLQIYPVYQGDSNHRHFDIENLLGGVLHPTKISLSNGNALIDLLNQHRF